jgi:hypothetical protein
MNKKHEEELMDELETFLEFEVDPDEKEDVELVETISTIKTKLENRGFFLKKRKKNSINGSYALRSFSITTLL